jgi:hypothetical protein
MTSVRDLDSRSLLAGAAVSVAITVPSGFIAGALSEDSNLVILFTLLVLVAPFLGGAVAARHHRRTSLIHGAAAAGIGWAVAIIVSVIAKLIAGDGVPIAAAILLGVWSVSIGMIGGYVTFRRELRET